MLLINQEEHTKQVENGIAYLNGLLPTNWQAKLDLHALDISSCEHCVLGQVWHLFPELFPPQQYQYDAYTSALTILYPKDPNWKSQEQIDDLYEWTVDHGFSIAAEDSDSLDTLNYLWRTKLRSYQNSPFTRQEIQQFRNDGLVEVSPGIWGIPGEHKES